MYQLLCSIAEDLENEEYERPLFASTSGEPSVKQTDDDNYDYELIGVTVHTGTADGGHYYSFIRDRTHTAKRDKWFLFNDAEVKPFDPNQIPAECFGGEMTVSLVRGSSYFFKWPYPHSAAFRIIDGYSLDRKTF